VIIDPHKGRINEAAETPREREMRGRLEKLEREFELYKRRLPPEPVPLNGEQKK
jgi:hypothetical protein